MSREKPLPLTLGSACRYNVIIVTKVDLWQLAIEIRHLERHQKLYRILRNELTKLGFWRKRPRGNPQKGYRAMKERTQKYDE